MVGYRNFKTFYTGFLQIYWKQYFPQLPSYQRFVELTHRALYPLTLFAQLKSGRKTGIYYIDGSCLPVCHLKRSKRNKVFQDIAQYGRTSVGWFFGLKIHLVINNLGEMIAFKITRGNVHDGAAAKSLLLSLEGLAFGDKGYIGKKTLSPAPPLFPHASATPAIAAASGSTTSIDATTTPHSLYQQ